MPVTQIYRQWSRPRAQHFTLPRIESYCDGNSILVTMLKPPPFEVPALDRCAKDTKHDNCLSLQKSLLNLVYMAPCKQNSVAKWSIFSIVPLFNFPQQICSKLNKYRCISRQRKPKLIKSVRNVVSANSLVHQQIESWSRNKLKESSAERFFTRFVIEFRRWSIVI